jgi:hypothetical protein
MKPEDGTLFYVNTEEFSQKSNPRLPERRDNFIPAPAANRTIAATSRRQAHGAGTQFVPDTGSEFSQTVPMSSKPKSSWTAALFCLVSLGRHTRVESRAQLP